MPPDSRMKRLKSCSEKPDGTKIHDDFYFRSYADVSIHETMLGDKIRTGTYRRAIMENSDWLKGKVVLDVGAGTGILSVFCVQAGAKKVYAVEASCMAVQAKKLVEENGMSQHIEVLQCVVEEAELPEKVDAIVSEWMGYSLLYETMLPSVLAARDKWLKPDGLMFPAEAALYLAPFSADAEMEEKQKFWEDLSETYDVCMGTLSQHSKEAVSDIVDVVTLPGESVMAHKVPLFRWDLRTVPTHGVTSVAKNFSMKCFGRSNVHGFVVWFDVWFPKNILLSTSPYSDETHWQHSLLRIPSPLAVEQDTAINGSIVILQNPSYNRYLDFHLTFDVDGQKKQRRSYKMTDF